MYDYVKHIRWAKIKTGLVITIALSVIFLAVMFAGNIEKLFTPKVNIYAVFDNVKGLRKGSPVWFAGFEIGSVKSIEFSAGQAVVVDMSINEEYLSYLKKNSRADILTLGLLGDKYVELTPGRSDAPPLEPGDAIEGLSHIEIQDVVETGKESIESVTDFVRMLEEFISKIDKEEGTFSRFLSDPSVYDNLKKTTEDLSRLLKKIQSGDSTVSRMLNEDALYNDISSSAEDISYFTERLRSSRGTIDKLIEDERLYTNINEVSERLNSLLLQIERGEGLVGNLMKDDELSVEMKTTLRELNALIKDIKKDPKKYFEFSIF